MSFIWHNAVARTRMYMLATWRIFTRNYFVIRSPTCEDIFCVLPSNSVPHISFFLFLHYEITTAFFRFFSFSFLCYLRQLFCVCLHATHSPPFQLISGMLAYIRTTILNSLRVFPVSLFLAFFLLHIYVPLDNIFFFFFPSYFLFRLVQCVFFPVFL